MPLGVPAFFCFVNRAGKLVFDAMKEKKWSVVALLLGICFWAVMTWPLPQHMSGGIGAAAVRHNWHDASVPRMMVPGDHLQLLYRFWLLQDMLVGETPPLLNVYEFNYRGDSDRYQPGFFYIPFSLCYAAMSPWLGQALAWNLVGLLSIFISAWAGFRWARRYSGNDPTPALMAALCCAAFPYRIHNLMGGSPAGFAMMWVPLLLYGLDRAIQDLRLSGGFVAGIALLFAAWTDMQVFAFCALLAAAWTPIAIILGHFRGNKREGRLPWRRGLVVFSPALVMGALGAVSLFCVKRAIDASKDMSAGRTIGEVAKFSPRVPDLFRFWIPHPRGELVYLGVLAIVVILAGCIFAWRRRVTWRWGLLLVTLALCSMAWFSVGPHAPDGGAFFKVCRFIIPPLKMMRQPAKVLCLFAPLLGLALTLAVRSLPVRRGSPVIWCLMALVLVDFAWRTRPEISLLAHSHPVYAAVAESAEQEGREAHAIALPLWPGDSHWSGVYIHYAALYRIRMVNGYSPIASQHYYDSVFIPLRSLNSGYVNDQQLDQLLEMGVSHILLHEDAFPEKVSPFPVGHTLRSLMRHPRLKREESSGNRVWSFRVLPSPTPEAVEDIELFGSLPAMPTRFFEFEKYGRDSAVVDASCSGSGFSRLTLEGTSTVSCRRAGIVDLPDASFWLRIRGKGSYRVGHRGDDGELCWESQSETINADNWKWVSIPVSCISGYQVGRTELTLEQGSVDADCILFTYGDAEEWMARGNWTIPASWFFHGGESSLSGEVTFTPGLDPAGGVLYGPRMPFPAGEYEIELHFTAAGEKGYRVASFGADSGEVVAVRAGEELCSLRLTHPHNLPLRFTLLYRAEETLTVRNVIIKRLK